MAVGSGREREGGKEKRQKCVRCFFLLVLGEGCVPVRIAFSLSVTCPSPPAMPIERLYLPIHTPAKRDGRRGGGGGGEGKRLGPRPRGSRRPLAAEGMA